MTVRTDALDRLPTDILLERLRKAPGCRMTREALIRRGCAREVFEIVRGEAEDGWLATQSWAALAELAQRLDYDIGAGLA